MLNLPMHDIHNGASRLDYSFLSFREPHVFVPVRHRLTTITEPFMYENGHNFSTMKAAFMREGRITPLSNPAYPRTGL